MKKQKFKIGRYISELSIVILGVLISLFLNGKITERNERKDLKLQLLAVQAELEDNLKFIEAFVRHYEQVNLTRKNVQAGTWDDNDLQAAAWMVYFHYKRDALDMLKNTGYLRLVKNKQQLLDILECYHLMELAKTDHHEFTTMKISKIDIIGNNVSFERYKEWIVFMNDAEFYFERSKEQINKVLTYKF